MKTLKAFDFRTSTRSRYDWDRLLDGGVYQLIEGDDIAGKLGNFVVLAARQAAKRGKTLRRQKTEDGKGLVIQAVEADGKE